MKSKIILLLSAFVILVSCKGESCFTSYVNPMIGTDYNGHTFPGAFVPFGMVDASPDTGLWGWEHCSGYRYADKSIMGFSQTHMSGTGRGDHGDLMLMPVTGDPMFVVGDEDNPDSGYRSRFSHDTEVARPGYYAVTLDDYDIRCEVTATNRCPMYRFTFPKGRRAGIIFDMTHGVGDTLLSYNLEKAGEMALRGFRHSNGFVKDHTFYFHAEFSQKPTGWQFTEDSSRVYVEFPEGKQVLVRMGVSTVGVEGAAKNLSAEIGKKSFDAVEKAARGLWEDALSRIEVREAVCPEDLTVFYTALYHTMCAPINISDVDGNHYGFDGKVHHADAPMYTTYSLWDTYRALHPFYNLVYRDKNIEFVNSMIEIWRERGQLPIHVFGISEAYGMICIHALPVLAEAIVQDISGFDYEEAYKAMKEQALDCSYRFTKTLSYLLEDGYIPVEVGRRSVSKVLEYAFDEWCVGRAAEKLGKSEDADYFYGLAATYKNLFDPVTGFFRGKDMDGNWVEPFDPYIAGNNFYTEGNAWQYNFYVPQDMTTYVGMLGGDEAFVAKLDEMFNTTLESDKIKVLDVSGLVGQYAHGNEPSHHAAYLYNYAGQPWKTQEMVARIKREMYTAAADGLCGNEDYGQMSAWYLLSALGFYPVTPAGDYYVIGTPTFKEVSVSLANGSKLVIKAPEVSMENIYIQSATFNGEPYTKSYITVEDANKGGVLEFVMGPEPNPSWGSSPEDRPVSLIR